MLDVDDCIAHTRVVVEDFDALRDPGDGEKLVVLVKLDGAELKGKFEKICLQIMKNHKPDNC